MCQSNGNVGRVECFRTNVRDRTETCKVQARPEDMGNVTGTRYRGQRASWCRASCRQDGNSGVPDYCVAVPRSVG